MNKNIKYIFLITLLNGCSTGRGSSVVRRNRNNVKFSELNDILSSGNKSDFINFIKNTKEEIKSGNLEWNLLTNILKEGKVEYLNVVPDEFVNCEGDNGLNILHLLSAFDSSLLNSVDLSRLLQRIKDERFIKENGDSNTPVGLAILNKSMSWARQLLGKMERLLDANLRANLSLISASNSDKKWKDKDDNPINFLTLGDEFDDTTKPSVNGYFYELSKMTLPENRCSGIRIASLEKQNKYFANLYRYAINIVDFDFNGQSPLADAYDHYLDCKNKGDSGKAEKVYESILTLLDRKIFINESEGDQEWYLCVVNDFQITSPEKGKQSFIEKVTRENDWKLLDKCFGILLSYKEEKMHNEVGTIVNGERTIEENSLLNHVLTNTDNGIGNINVIGNYNDITKEGRTILGKICEEASKKPQNETILDLLRKATSIGFDFKSKKIYNSLDELDKCAWDHLKKNNLRKIVNEIREKEGMSKIK